MTTNQPVDQATALIQQLADGVTACLEFCDANPGSNFPDFLASALTAVAFDRGGSDALTVHRPGSWEAGHVEALAAHADYQIKLDQEATE